MATAADTRFLERSEGRLAYTVTGSGPLVLCLPGMGDLSGSYRFLVPALVDAGFRVAVSDLRGHGESDATFSRYGDAETAHDIDALLLALGAESAIVIGNSMAAGAAVLAAARPDTRISGLVLIGPFVRNPPTGAVSGFVTRLLLRAALLPVWAAASWNRYLPTLYAGEKPADFETYRARVIASLRRPGYARAFSLTARTSHDAAEKALPLVRVPVLVVMGALDPDFRDPQAEARWIADQLAGQAETVLVPDAGHYPHSQHGERVAESVIPFLQGVTHHA